MRSFRHWTARYIVDRMAEILYQRMHPDHPWLTNSANMILESLLRTEDVGLEFGSGRSTLWFAQRIRALTSVEHDLVWYNRILNKIKENQISNVSYLFVPERDRDEEEVLTSPYVQVANNFPKNSLDFVLVDGICRSASAVTVIVIECIRPGGILIIDNVNWYLPSNSRSPASRSIAQGPASPRWAQFFIMVSHWRSIWTSNGVTDTALFIKPYHQVEQ